MEFQASDLLIILVLVVLEGLLSGDNALVLAVLVMPLPEEQQRKALRYGLIGAFVLRTIATFMAVWLSKQAWVALAGGLYLMYLAYRHFTHRPDEHEDATAKAAAATGFLGLSLFWATVAKVELTDLVFAVDSILVAVAMVSTGREGGAAGKEWVIITGGVLGIVMMRLLTMQVLRLVRTYPRLIDGAYVVVLWVGIKLLWEYLHRTVEVGGEHVIPAIPKWLSIGMVFLTFGLAFLYARRQEGEALAETAEEAEVIIEEEAPDLVTPDEPGRAQPGRRRGTV